MKMLKPIAPICLSLFLEGYVPHGLLSTASVQDDWEYDSWEGEWEHHYPTAGLEYDYENGETDVESEQYEWEDGEGYHEQAWYHPSDWFTTGRDVEYENDDYYASDYYHDDSYTDQWYDDEYDDTWYWWP
ncbi:hypothetical protein SH139x_002977 [Planctomycetaceae bacterium SH139]